MRFFFAVFLLLLGTAGCDLQLAPAVPSPTMMRFPVTWTPAPTYTPLPPTPTNTLVIQDSPVMTRTPAANVRPYPDATNGTIGRWAETASLPADQLGTLAPLIRVVTGPQALAARRLNWRLIALARLDAGQPGNLVSRAISATQSYDGLLLEHVVTDTLPSTDALLASLRAPLGKRLLVASTYAWNDGAAYAAHTADAQALLKRVDGACLCNFLRASDTPTQTFKSEVEWKKDVDALAALSQAPSTFTLVSTPFKLSGGDPEQLRPWLDYALASFLLGANGTHAYFNFQGPLADGYMSSRELDTALGYPSAAYYQNAGLYVRQFQKGMVAVNPGDYARELPLARPYLTLEGEQITRLRLEPRTGTILTVVQ